MVKSPSFWLGTSEMDPTCLLSPWCGQEACFPQSRFCQHVVVWSHISCEPSELCSPMPPCYVLYHDWAGRTKIPFDRCLYVGLKSLRMECALQLPAFPAWYKKALFNLVNTSLAELFVINVQFLPYMLEISCLLVALKKVSLTLNHSHRAQKCDCLSLTGMLYCPFCLLRSTEVSSRSDTRWSMA